MKSLLILLTIGLAGCTANSEMKGIQYDYLLNDGNSKVWMIEKMIVDKSNITSQFDEEKELIIFYQTGRFQYIPLKKLGHSRGKIGNYFLSSDEKELKMYFKKDYWQFKLEEISEDSIYLVPMKESRAKFSMQLVPLKEISI